MGRRRAAAVTGPTVAPGPVATSGEVTIGVDVGGTKILGVVLHGETVVAERRTSTPAADAARLEAGIRAVVDELQADAGGAATGIGVGLPGLVDRQGTLRFAPNLPGIEDFAVGRRLADLTGLPVRVDNDATCAAWAERALGAARGSDDCVLVTLGTGIGGGIIADGCLLRGARGFAGEIGHMVVVKDGVPCPCGRRGCWERYASGSGLGRMGREAAVAGRLASATELAGGDADRVTGHHVTAAAHAGAADALAVVEELAGWLASGLANLVNVLDPDLFVIGGGLGATGEILLEPARRGLAERLLGDGHRPDVAVVGAVLGEQAGAVGAALLARPRP